VLGILDHRILRNIKMMKTTSQRFSFMALSQRNPLLISIHRARQMSIIKNDRSNGLESGVAPDDGNQEANGLLEI